MHQLLSAHQAELQAAARQDLADQWNVVVICVRCLVLSADCVMLLVVQHL